MKEPNEGACESNNNIFGSIKGIDIWSVWLTVSFLRRTPLSRIGHS